MFECQGGKSSIKTEEPWQDVTHGVCEGRRPECIRLSCMALSILPTCMLLDSIHIEGCGLCSELSTVKDNAKGLDTLGIHIALVTQILHVI